MVSSRFIHVVSVALNVAEEATQLMQVQINAHGQTDVANDMERLDIMQRNAEGTDGACCIRTPNGCGQGLGQCNADTGCDPNKDWFPENAVDVDSNTCYARKAAYDNWCGISDTKVQWQPDGDCESLEDGACCVRTPNGCGQGLSQCNADKGCDPNKDWFPEDGVTVNSNTCCARKAAYDNWCSRSDTMVQWQPDGDCTKVQWQPDECEAPKEGACCIRTPNGCGQGLSQCNADKGCDPNKDWFPEDGVTVNSSTSCCARKAAYDDWCSRSDTKVQWQPDGDCTKVQWQPDDCEMPPTTPTPVAPTTAVPSTTPVPVVPEACPVEAKERTDECPEGCKHIESCEICELAAKFWGKEYLGGNFPPGEARPTGCFKNRNDKIKCNQNGPFGAAKKMTPVCQKILDHPRWQ